MAAGEAVIFREIVREVIEESQDHLSVMREALASADIQINSSLHAVTASRRRLEAVRIVPVWGAPGDTR